MKPYNSGARKPWGLPRTTKIGGKLIGLPESNSWNLMHNRCGNTSDSQKLRAKNQAYAREGAWICDEWFDYQSFASWWHTIEFRQIGWCLDKDILFKGNKLYSPETCCFVPAEVNILFINNRINRGEYPLGVYMHPINKNYVASLRRGDRSLSQHIGSFSTVEEAFHAYKREKELFIKERANKWKDLIDPKVYEAMMNWQVEITD